MYDDVDIARRFSGIRRLYGAMGLDKLQSSHVVVIGVGGVGSWAAEALARSAIGKITLIDLDNIAQSNVNRQIHAVEANVGKAKVTAMQERIHGINPNCTVYEIEDFVTTDNINEILNFDCDVILDCTDSTYTKMALAVCCRKNKLPLMMSGSAGGRLDPTRIKVADLSTAFGDMLLSKVRKQLRQSYHFPKAPDTAERPSKKPKKFNVLCVYSDEAVTLPEHTHEAGNLTNINGLNCAGFGSSVSVTGSMGFIAAQEAIRLLLT